MTMRCLLVLLLLPSLDFVASYNLGSKFARIISDPNMQRHSYFGYSVALRRQVTEAGDVPGIVIGAPRGNSTFLKHQQLKSPGVLYVCAVHGPKTCVQFVLEQQAISSFDEGSLLKVKSKKDGAGIGSSIDVIDVGDGMVVCAPKWKNNYVSEQYLLNGACYWSNSTLDPQRTFHTFYPLIDFSKQIKDKAPFYSYGEAGFSVKIFNNGQEIIMGAPGVMNWTGTVIRYQVNETTAEFSRYALVAENLPILGNDSYLGYSVEVLKLLNGKHLYASGAPRAAGIKGKVFLFDFVWKGTAWQYHVEHELEGQQFGEYFGAVLCAADLNGDGLDDLLVGAPQHSLDSRHSGTAVGDEGRVYVFMNHGQTAWRNPGELIMGLSTRGAKFGTAISSLGDINMDGLPEIAIGAPYEENGKGAVYIYHGSKDGLCSKYTQRLSAEEISPSLRGFGMSISKGVDVDGNFYNDVAIGSYISGHAVLVKTYPVAIIRPRMSSNVTKIGFNESQFEVKTCLLYSGKYVPSKIDIQITLKADPTFKRAFIVADGSAQRIVSFTATYERDNDTCRAWTVHIEGTTDYSKPIEVALEYELPTPASSFSMKKKRQIIQDMSEYFCKECPVLDPTVPNILSVKVPYAMVCRLNSTCKTDLSIAYEFVNVSIPFVIGSSESVAIKLTVMNRLEPAFMPMISVFVPHFSPFKRTPPSCQESGHDVLQMVCDLDGVLRENEKKTFMLELDISRLAPDVRYLHISASVTSDGMEQNDTDNQLEITLPLRAEVDVVISGKAKQDQMYYMGKKEEQLQEAIFSHVYEIVNNGPSPVTSMILDFNIPHKVRNRGVLTDVVEVNELVAYMNYQSFLCEFISEKSLDTSMDSSIRRRRSLSGTNHGTPDNRTFVLDCARHEVQCRTVRCSLQLLMPGSSLAKVTFHMAAFLQLMGPLLEKRDIVLIRTSGHIKMMDESIHVVSSDRRSQEVTVQTVLWRELPDDSMDTTLLTISIVSGVLILLLITTCLVKVGFFERRDHKKLVEAKYTFPFENVLIFEPHIQKKNKLRRLN